jgi:cell division septation protein DedD
VIPAVTPVEKPASKVDAVAKVEPVAPLAAVRKLETKAEVKLETKAESADKPAMVKPAAERIAEALAPRSERGVEQVVSQATAGSYFVQHVSLSSMSEAQEWRAQFPVLKKSRIAAVKTQDQGVKFAVLSGPFANRKEAEVFAGRQGVPADPWLRPLASLQKALLAPRR